VNATTSVEHGSRVAGRLRLSNSARTNLPRGKRKADPTALLNRWSKQGDVKGGVGARHAEKIRSSNSDEIVRARQNGPARRGYTDAGEGRNLGANQTASSTCSWARPAGRAGDVGLQRTSTVVKDNDAATAADSFRCAARTAERRWRSTPGGQLDPGQLAGSSIERGQPPRFGSRSPQTTSPRQRGACAGERSDRRHGRHPRPSTFNGRRQRDAQETSSSRRRVVRPRPARPRPTRSQGPPRTRRRQQPQVRSRPSPRHSILGYDNPANPNDQRGIFRRRPRRYKTPKARRTVRQRPSERTTNNEETPTSSPRRAPWRSRWNNPQKHVRQLSPSPDGQRQTRCSPTPRLRQQRQPDATSCRRGARTRRHATLLGRPAFAYSAASASSRCRRRLGSPSTRVATSPRPSSIDVTANLHRRLRRPRHPTSRLCLVAGDVGLGG